MGSILTQNVVITPCVEYLRLILWVLGKSAKSVKAKNSKGSRDPETTSKSKSKSPRRNPLFEADSDDDDLGQEPPLMLNCVAKFSDKFNPGVAKMIKTEDLLAGQFATLCDKLVVFCN